MRFNIGFDWRVALIAGGVVLWPGAEVGAQQQAPPLPQDTGRLRQMAEERLGRRITQQEILSRLRESGMTRSQVQARLQAMGYDPRLADQYFDALSQGQTGMGVTPPAPTDQLVTALRQVGVDLRVPVDSVTVLDSLAADSALADAERSRIFGKTLFARASTQFEPVLTGPVSRSYRVGPGDEVYLILTGDVEASYPLTVTREGFLIIPQVGQVPVSGLTIEELEDRLYTYLGRAYSGVRRGPEATTRFQVSLGQLRANHVFVVGEVERPSGYEVSPMARAFNALYRAGGPNENGSFRSVIVRRDGEAVAEVDLYPYLLAGDATEDVRLEQGDMVFVPITGPRVSVEGAVRRPGIFEIKPGEGLREVLMFAGGPEAAAVLDQVQIDRILPPSERTPGRERTLIDIDVSRVLDQEGVFVPLKDGDIITLSTVSKERRNRVSVSGAVRRPGQYEWGPGMTLEDLLEEASGLAEGAYTPRALVYRLQEDNTRRMLRSPLTGEGAGLLELADRDSVVVLREDSLRLPQEVAIAGYVKDPGMYPFAEAMSLRDLVLAAGGFTEGANVLAAEVARPVNPTERGAEIAQVIQVPLAASVEGIYDEDGVPEWRPEAEEFELQRGDRVYVRRAPGYEEVQSVQVTGEVAMPGEYELGSRQARIADVVQRAGGITPEAYPRGFLIIRDGQPIAGNLTAALADSMAPGNILLEPGDSLHVPQYDGTVEVTGAVLLEARVLYEAGRSLQDYIERAGGYAENADRDRVVVTYPNGERRTRSRYLAFEREPDVQPGSNIFVPSDPIAEQDAVDWDSVLSRSLGVISTLATLLLALDRIGN